METRSLLDVRTSSNYGAVADAPDLLNQVHLSKLWQVPHWLGFCVGAPTLSSASDTSPPLPWQNAHPTACIQAHGLPTGGTSFIAGTACLFSSDWAPGPLDSALLYIIGSLGFLAVDVMEFFTFTEDKLIRLNISISMSGSAAYVVGSVGFLPAVYALSPSIGIWGFIVGSVLIGVSQLWKTHRIGSSEGQFSLPVLWGSLDALTQVGVELNAGLGAWSFFVGTVIYLHGPDAGATLQLVLQIWIVGSIFFTLGSFFLAYRHFIMHA
jgi:hypothetical protein